MYKNHCSEMLESIYQRSKSAQRKLVEYILNNKQKVAGQTIFELSENAGVSYATVCRLVKALGYGGYRDLKRALVDELYESKAEQYELDLATDTSQILRQLCRAISAAVLVLFRLWANPWLNQCFTGTRKILQLLFL